MTEHSSGSKSYIFHADIPAELLKIIFNSVPYGIMVSDESNRILYINLHGLEMLGYTEIEKVHNKRCQELFFHLDIPSATSYGEAINQHESTMLKADGSTIPVLLTHSAIPVASSTYSLITYTNISGQVLIKEALIEHERALDSLMNSIPGMAYRCINDEQWTMIFLSQGCEDLTGYTSDQLINNAFISYDDIIHPDDRRRVWEEVQEGLSTTGSYILQYRIVMRNKQVKTVWERGHGIYGKNSELRFLEGFITDITEQKSAEQVQHVLYEISKSAYLATTLDEFYVAVHNHLGAVIDARNFYVAMYDKKTDSITLPYHVDYQDRFKSFPAGKTMTGYVIRTRKALLATEKTITELHKAGEIDIVGTPSKVWLGVPMIVSGDVIGVIAVQSYTDPDQYSQKELELLRFIADQVAIFISRKSAEEVGLRESAYLSQLFEGSPEAIIMIDNEHHIVKANRGFHLLFGYTEEETKGKDIDTLIATPETFTEAKNFSEKVIRGEITELETRRKHKDGHLIDVSLLVTPVVINGKITGGYGIYRNITDRKRIEKNLIEAKEKAEESDKLKSAFLSNMSHEIRTPMNAILGFSTLLSEPGMSEEEKLEFIHIIKERGNDLMRIIDDIIDVAKIESGQIKIEIRECPVNILLNNLELTLNEVRKKQMKEHIGLRLVPGTHDNDFSILTDGNRLRQVLTNLIENALKFTDEGYVEFGYTFREWINREPVIEFYVKDTGIGIPEESQHLIFERFRQVDDTHTRKYGGTGLGLTIVKNLVHLLGGDIRVQSAVKKGATFYITLPLQTGMTKVLEKTADRPSMASGSEWGNKHLLVVEDEESNYFLLDRILKKTGIKTSWARNGLEAIEMFRKDKYDIILMDIRMPVMDGYEATQEIKKINKDIPVIAQTAYALKGEKEKSLAAGCDAYVSKPIDSKELIALLQKHLNPAQ